MSDIGKSAMRNMRRALFNIDAECSFYLAPCIFYRHIQRLNRPAVLLLRIERCSRDPMKRFPSAIICTKAILLALLLPATPGIARGAAQDLVVTGNARVDHLLAQMTLEEKIVVIH